MVYASVDVWEWKGRVEVPTVPISELEALSLSVAVFTSHR